MSLDAATKKQIITEFGTKEGDTGSPEVQVAMLSHKQGSTTAGQQGKTAGIPDSTTGGAR